MKKEFFLLTTDNLSEIRLNTDFELKPNLVKVSMNEVVVITTDGCCKNYVCFQLSTEERLYLKTSLTRLVSELHEEVIRINNYQLVNKAFISGINGLSNVYVGTREKNKLFTVSRVYQTNIKKLIGGFGIVQTLRNMD